MLVYSQPKPCSHRLFFFFFFGSSWNITKRTPPHTHAALSTWGLCTRARAFGCNGKATNPQWQMLWRQQWVLHLCYQSWPLMYAAMEPWDHCMRLNRALFYQFGTIQVALSMFNNVGCELCLLYALRTSVVSFKKKDNYFVWKQTKYD